MANLLEVVGSSIPVGTIIKAVGPPDSTWLKCDGDILNQSAYPAYVSVCDELHPMIWKDWSFIDVDQSTTGTSKYAIDRIGDLIVCVGVGSTVWVSSDGGETWSTNTNLSASSHYVLANNGTYFVTAGYGSSNAYYSSDGSTWNTATLPASSSWRYLTYANGYFILMASGYFSNPMPYAYSSNGTTWSAGSFSVGDNGYVGFLSSDGSQHMCFFYYSDDHYKLHTSTNGTTWSSGTSDFFHGGPYWDDDIPVAIHYLNGEYYMPWYADNSYYLKYEGTDIKDVSDWYRYPMMAKVASLDYFNMRHAVWTGNHIIIPNNYSSEDGMLVGTSMESLTLFRTALPDVEGIVNDGEDWAVCLPTTQGMHTVGRSVGVNYTKATQFQLPLLETVTDNPRIYNYIKVAE